MGSCDDLLHHLAGHISQPERAAVVLEGKPLVIEAHEVEHRGVQVVDVDLALDTEVTKVVRRAMAMPPFTPPPAIHIVNAWEWWSRPMYFP